MPRVRITYQALDRDGSPTVKELPFVVGVLGDFLGSTPAKHLRDAQFVEVDADNFDVVMTRLAPSLSLRVEDTLSGREGEMVFRLAFACLDDFGPARVVEQIEPLRKLRATRARLARLREELSLDEDAAMEQQISQAAAGATTVTVDAQPVAPTPPAVRDPIEEILDAGFSPQQPRPDTGWLAEFRTEPSPARALALWLGPNFSFAGAPREVKDRIARRLDRDVARLDRLITDQVNAVLHHKAFQRLEAAWRGLRYLVDRRPERYEGGAEGGVVIKVLNLSRAELVRDVGQAIEFDQSFLFRKVYSEGIDMPGGYPFGVLLGDYEFTNHPEDVELLKSIAQVAAASFAPFIAAAGPGLLALRTYADLERVDPHTLNSILTDTDNNEYLKWRTLRQSEDARFLALTLPHLLLRRPYGDDPDRRDGFHFREETGPGATGGYLWGNAAFAYGAVLIRTFAQSGWLAETRGVRRRPGDGEPNTRDVRGGVVTDLPIYWFDTDRRGLVPRCPTEVVITDALDKVLGDLGFLPLCWCQDTDVAVFYGSQSIQTPKTYDRQDATINARLSAMLQYVFCASRFAHHVKILARERIGSYKTPADLETELNRWLMQYVNASPSSDQNLLARYPLRDGRAEVREVSGRPGRYTCQVYLRPQFQLDQLAGTIRLETRPFSVGA